jgi:hypothetical protein
MNLVKNPVRKFLLLVLAGALAFSITAPFFAHARGARLDYMLDRLSKKSMEAGKDKHNIYLMDEVKSLSNSIADRVILDRTPDTASAVASYVKSHSHMEFVLNDLKRSLKSSVVRSISLDNTLEKERILNNTLEAMQTNYDEFTKRDQTYMTTPGVSQPTTSWTAGSLSGTSSNSRSANTNLAAKGDIPGGGDTSSSTHTPYPNVTHHPEDYDTWVGWSQYGKWIPIYSKVQFQKAYVKTIWDGYWQGKKDALKWKDPAKYYTVSNTKGLPISWTNGIKVGYTDGYRVGYKKYNEIVRRKD